MIEPINVVFLNFIKFNRTLVLKIYKDIKAVGTLTTEIKDLIINSKSSFAPMTMPVGKDQMLFLFTWERHLSQYIMKVMQHVG